MKNKKSILGARPMVSLSAITGSMIVAFVIGIHTAGDVAPLIEETRAGGPQVEGDMDHDGDLDDADVLIALSIARGERQAEPEELLADPNKDYRITLEDVETMLQTIERRRAS